LVITDIFLTILFAGVSNSLVYDSFHRLGSR